MTDSVMDATQVYFQIYAQKKSATELKQTLEPM